MKSASAIVDRLCGGGYKAYFVGGCVRDRLLGKQPHDWDIATSATPQQVAALFADCRLVTSGAAYGTVGVVWDGALCEVTSFRAEGAYTDHRRPDAVQFGVDLHKDLARRDFTINAMALAGDGRLHDPFGGQQDLQAGLLRCVGDPPQRFAQDALRILRALRFAAVLGFAIEGQTLQAAVNAAPLLQGIAAERIFAELNKLLQGEWAGQALLLGAPILQPLLCLALPHWNATAQRVACADKRVRWAVLLQGSEGAVLQRLQAPARLQKEVALLHHWAQTPPPQTAVQTRFLLHALGAQTAEQLLLLWQAAPPPFPCATACTAPENAPVQPQAPCTPENPFSSARVALFARLLQQEIAQNSCVSLAQLAINGTDLLQHKLCTQGAQVGQTLRYLLQAVMQQAVPNQKQALLALAKKQLQA